MFCKLDVRRKSIVTLALSYSWDNRKIVVRYFVNRVPGQKPIRAPRSLPSRTLLDFSATINHALTPPPHPYTVLGLHSLRSTAPRCVHSHVGVSWLARTRARFPHIYTASFDHLKLITDTLQAYIYLPPIGIVHASTLRPRKPFVDGQWLAPQRGLYVESALSIRK